jgi:putative hydrolase of the HAD superfamily
MLTLKELFSEFDLSAKGIDDFEKFYPRYSEHNHRLWDRYTKGIIKQDELRWKRMWLTLLDFKIANEPLARNMSQRYLEILPTQKMLFPHTTEILNYLQDKGYHMHIISNGFEEVQHRKLTNANLKKFFKEIVTSEASGYVKPAKGIFDFALQKTNAALQESIMIGDNLNADIKGAMDAGMDTIFVNHINEKTELTPTYTIKHLQQLEDIL